ncbi:uncharacterized protein LOC108907088 [Anoplophora glabripennis]|uniref:uncharacterized protein LOC108907088 n=1 Tax=Anoplophora glabripennis TaxID=217634 RepID=UPI000874D7DE|nr:uncharacterized protein LOC108907088 [Anoplophora glabripennis]
MRLPMFLFFSLALFGLSLCDTDDKEKFKEELKEALKKLVEKIDENEMNVTVVSSDVRHWADGEVKQVKEYSIRMPTNNVQPTESKITTETIQDWINTFKGTQFIGRSRTTHIKDGKTEEIDRVSTTDEKWYETRLYRTVTSVKDGERGFAVENPSYENYYNIYVPGADGRKEKIQVFAGHVETEVLKKSDSMPDDEVREAENKLRESFFKYDCRKVIGRVIKDHMNSKFEGNDWQVIVDPGDEFYVPAKKFGWIKAANTEVLIYSM